MLQCLGGRVGRVDDVAYLHHGQPAGDPLGLRPEAEVEVGERIDEHPADIEQCQVSARLNDAELSLLIQRGRIGKQLWLPGTQLETQHGQEGREPAFVLVGGLRFRGAADEVSRPVRVLARQLGEAGPRSPPKSRR